MWKNVLECGEGKGRCGRGVLVFLVAYLSSYHEKAINALHELA